jgi:hypothetical protein
MDQMELWISNGGVVPKPELPDASSLPERIFLDRNNLVKLTSDEAGTKLKWHAFGPNWASLFFAKEWISTFPGPYTLNYYMSGWFSETLQEPADVRDRIDHIIFKSDLHLSSRVYIQSFDPNTRSLPDILRLTLEEGKAPVESSVDCSFDMKTGRVKVERIGTDSALAKLWGVLPVTTPCLSGTSYDKIVSRAYGHVLRSGRPHYDHVYAAMMGADGEVAWIPYQRIVMPLPKARGRSRMVSVVCEVTPVEISVV